jgi:hypothetical protein
VDFFDAFPSDHLYDTPYAVARVFRSVRQTRTIDIEAIWNKASSTVSWTILRGDPAKITLDSMHPDNREIMRITIAHHTPYDTPEGDGRAIRTSRVDIGVMVKADGVYSMPCIVSLYFLGNETREYDADGRILAVDYTRPVSDTTDPTLSCRKNWKDLYRYDALGRPAGWTRVRGSQEERFTAFGHRVTETDAEGRPLRASIVRYMIRTENAGEDSPPPTQINLAQVDDNQTVGAPDPASFSQGVQPPEPVVFP